MSKGGSLRMSTAPKAFSGSTTVSCGRYQSSSLSVSEMRAAWAATSLFQKRSSCRQTKTEWPRFCAARIIVTVVSLYALSDSGGSTTNRIRAARLLALFLLGSRRSRFLEAGAGGVRHEHHGARDLGVGKRAVAAFRRHRAFALERDLHHRAQAVLDARRQSFLSPIFGAFCTPVAWQAEQVALTIASPLRAPGAAAGAPISMPDTGLMR